MSEELAPQRPERNPIEVRYRYLADLNRQESPNLRKLYCDSFSRNANSNRRSSSSHRRCSPQQSSHKRSTFINRYSPSCSTFNPKRQITQDQFSPYDDKADREDEKLNQELREQIVDLRSQLTHATQISQSLKIELSRRDAQVVQLREASQNDLRYFEKVVAEMTGQIQILLTKNKILENQLVVAKTRLQDELRRQQEYAKKEEERKRIELRRLDQRSRDASRSIGHSGSNSQVQTRRSVGKLLVRPQVEQKQVLGTSKIKIEEDSESGSQLNCDSKANEPAPSQISHISSEKQAKKSEELIESIRSMFFKIKGQQSSSLRQLWKWLKGLGHSQSCLKRWKSRAESSSYMGTDKLRELMKEGCQYIQ